MPLRISHPNPLESPLSSLYQTRTILRRSYASDAFGEIDTLELKRQARNKISSDWSKVNRSPTRTRRSIKPVQTRDQTLRRASPASSSSRRTAPPSQEREPREWIDHVPFEGIPERPATILDRLQGQTITRHEFNIFKDILARGASAENAAKEAAKRKRRWDSTGRARGIVRKGVEMPDLLKPLAEEAETISKEKVKERKEEEVVVAKEEARSKNYRKKVEKPMEGKRRDVDLWAVWETRLKNDVLAVLGESTNGAEEKKKKKEGAVDLQILTATLPQLLLHMSALFRDMFPGSQFPLSIIHSLRQLGPQAFALGATTQLFNAHMRCLFETYTDLDGILETLSEMEREVYEFDEGTHQLLEDIFSRAEKAHKSGGAVGAFWGTERRVRGLEKLEAWEKIVAERIGRQEARKRDWNRGVGREDVDGEEMKMSGLSVSD